LRRRRQRSSLILNLKKSPDRRGRPEWRFKEQAIAQVAAELRAAMDPRALARSLLVPVPPSRAPGDPLHDDRMLQVAGLLARSSGAVVADLLQPRVSTTPLHLRDDRRDLDQLRANLRLVEPAPELQPSRIFVLDDVLTTGAHFRVAKDALCSAYPGVAVIGLFVARRVPAG
jgi:predicted amidophosphoribosyltransferase